MTAPKEEAGPALLRAFLQPIWGRGLLVTAGGAALVYEPLGIGTLLAWAITVLFSALIVARREEPRFPLPRSLREPGLAGLWQRALATCALVEGPVLVILVGLILARAFPDDPVLETGIRILVPLCGFLAFITLAFIPGALIVAVRDVGREPFMLFLTPRRVTRATQEAAGALIVAVLGFFMLFVAIALLQAVLPQWLWPWSQTALAIWWHLTVAGLTALSLPGADGKAVLRL